MQKVRVNFIKDLDMEPIMSLAIKSIQITALLSRASLREEG